MRPLIGITGSLETLHNDKRYKPFTATYTPHDFAKAVFQAGGMPIVLPLLEDRNFDQVVQSLDGLVLTGGCDVSPEFYNEEPQIGLGYIFPQRDRQEIGLIKEALKINLPILGICRGLQLINVVHGGSLYQDTRYMDNVSIQHVQNADVEVVTHKINVRQDSLLAEMMQTGDYVNTIHHQAIKQLGQDLQVSAWSTDNVIEAIESTDEAKTILAVQWHPELTHKERSESQAIFRNLIERAQAYRNK